MLIATTIGVPAALAWLMDSIVCGMMPSSAATTRMAISVTIAPRARMVVKASWPGVSEEGDGAAVDHHAVRADVLRNAARLARNDVRAADAVEQGGLAVVDVAHDDDDRRAGDEFVLGIDVIVNKTVLDRHNDLVLHLAAELHGDERGGIVIDHIGHGRPSRRA